MASQTVRCDSVRGRRLAEDLAEVRVADDTAPPSVVFFSGSALYLYSYLYSTRIHHAEVLSSAHSPQPKVHAPAEERAAMRASMGVSSSRRAEAFPKLGMLGECDELAHGNRSWLGGGVCGVGSGRHSSTRSTCTSECRLKSPWGHRAQSIYIRGGCLWALFAALCPG